MRTFDPSASRLSAAQEQVLAWTKQQVRRAIKSRLELLRPEDSLFLRERLHRNIELFLESRPGLWASYRPFGFEARPPHGRFPGIEWAHPRIEGEHIVFCRGEDFEEGPLRLQQPVASSERVLPGDLAGVLVPGLAFDRSGRRLGRGGGYYDRMLSGLNVFKVGIAHACQMLPVVPAATHDVRMDAVVTEQTVILTGGKEQWRS